MFFFTFGILTRNIGKLKVLLPNATMSVRPVSKVLEENQAAPSSWPWQRVHRTAVYVCNRVDDSEHDDTR